MQSSLCFLETMTASQALSGYYTNLAKVREWATDVGRQDKLHYILFPLHLIKILTISVTYSSGWLTSWEEQGFALTDWLCFKFSIWEQLSDPNWWLQSDLGPSSKLENYGQHTLCLNLHLTPLEATKHKLARNVINFPKKNKKLVKKIKFTRVKLDLRKAPKLHKCNHKTKTTTQRNKICGTQIKDQNIKSKTSTWRRAQNLDVEHKMESWKTKGTE